MNWPAAEVQCEEPRSLPVFHCGMVVFQADVAVRVTPR